MAGLTEPDCGGCKGLGAHSRRCRTNPGWFWYRLQDQAEMFAATTSFDPIMSAKSYVVRSRCANEGES